MNKKKAKPSEFDIDQIKTYMKLPAKKKFEHIERMNIFLNKAMPARSKKIWQQLKEKGW